LSLFVLSVCLVFLAVVVQPFFHFFEKCRKFNFIRKLHIRKRGRGSVGVSNLIPLLFSFSYVLYDSIVYNIYLLCRLGTTSIGRLMGTIGSTTFMSRKRTRQPSPKRLPPPPSPLRKKPQLREEARGEQQCSSTERTHAGAAAAGIYLFHWIV
jgi:hypothetical protein